MSDPYDTNTFTTLYTVSFNNDCAWHEYLYSLENYTGNGTFVAVKADSTAGDFWSTQLDDFTLEMRPDCHRVETITVSNITNVSATLQWTEMGSATGWNIEYQADGEYDRSQERTYRKRTIYRQYFFKQRQDNSPVQA